MFCCETLLTSNSFFVLKSNYAILHHNVEKLITNGCTQLFSVKYCNNYCNLFMNIIRELDCSCHQLKALMGLKLKLASCIVFLITYFLRLNILILSGKTTVVFSIKTTSEFFRLKAFINNFHGAHTKILFCLLTLSNTIHQLNKLTSSVNIHTFYDFFSP